MGQTLRRHQGGCARDRRYREQESLQGWENTGTEHLKGWEEEEEGSKFQVSLGAQEDPATTQQNKTRREGQRGS